MSAPVRTRPILFSGEMVRALLDGTKTQTRRVMSPQPMQSIMDAEGWAALTGCAGVGLLPAEAQDERRIGWTWRGTRIMPWPHALRNMSPYGVPGDRLWVRETWKAEERTCDFSNPNDDHACSEHCQQRYVYYRATPRKGYRPVPDRASITYLDDSTPLTPFYETGWRPSIFMRPADSRITLEVTEVRIQRVQEIGGYDAAAEGIETKRHKCGCDRCAQTSEICPATASGLIHEYAALWDSINAKRGHGWDANPWVWCISFKRVTAP